VDYEVRLHYIKNEILLLLCIYFWYVSRISQQKDLTQEKEKADAYGNWLAL
jgi:hypothetical protein